MTKFAVGLFLTLTIFLAAFAADQFAVSESPDLPEMNEPRILVTKSARKLVIFDGEKLIKSYDIALGFTPMGDKEVEGDGKTPEGEFYIFTKNPESRFYLSLGISYPNEEDAKRGIEDGLISEEEHDAILSAVRKKGMPPQYTKLGGEIYIHGYGNMADWTSGCVALKNTDIKELFDALEVGTPVKIVP